MRNGIYEEGESFKKFIYCAYVKSGYATEDGTIKIDDIAKEYPPEYDLINVMEKCLDNDSDPIAKIFNFFKCFQQTTPIRMGF